MHQDFFIYGPKRLAFKRDSKKTLEAKQCPGNQIEEIRCINSSL
jgi:hypothetical protein